MTGNTFKVIREFYPTLISQVMVRGAIYARMAPEQKQQLVEMLQTVGYYVAMCGDGANDCGALKVGKCGMVKSIDRWSLNWLEPRNSAIPELHLPIRIDTNLVLMQFLSQLMQVFPCLTPKLLLPRHSLHWIPEYHVYRIYSLKVEPLWYLCLESCVLWPVTILRHFWLLVFFTGITRRLQIYRTFIRT